MKITPKQQRGFFIILMLIGIGLSLFFFMLAFKEDITFFYTPSDFENKLFPKKEIRLGGIVKEGSLINEDLESLKISFIVTDMKAEVLIHYEGILPNLFREGQGIVAVGRFDEGGGFVSKELLAKHDENYRPPALDKKLEKIAE